MTCLCECGVLIYGASVLRVCPGRVCVCVIGMCGVCGLCLFPCL